jgi:ABC-type xylose transport system substrate-binding protein
LTKVASEKELPAWFSVEKMEKNRFKTDQEKLVRDFDEFYAKPAVNLSKETAEKHLTPEDLELIDIKGTLG